MSRDKTFQAHKTSDGAILDTIAILTIGGLTIECEHVVEAFAELPRKVVLRKLDSLVRRNVIRTCTCGCGEPIVVLPPPEEEP